jgi:hypothetical protein
LGISDLISYKFSDKQQAFGQARVKNSGFVVFHLEVLLHIITEDNLRVSGILYPTACDSRNQSSKFRHFYTPQHVMVETNLPASSISLYPAAQREMLEENTTLLP